jgi:cytochrome c oxidase assembly protein subunit 15
MPVNSTLEYSSENSLYRPWLHRIAVLTAVCTFPLIFMGGLVTSHHAGMSVPDWPNSYGYNMFLFPPRLWIGGILYEHTHRLMASVVGFVSIILTIIAWKVESRRWVRWLATAVLGAVIFQGVLGGLRVVLVQLDLAIVHACFAQAFFCLTVLMATVTSRWWFAAPDLSDREAGNIGRRIVTIAVVAVLVIYAQLIVGAMMRHFQAGLAIPGVLVYGHFFPPTDAAGLAAANHLRVWKMGFTDTVTLGQIWLHFGHRIGAVLVTIAVLTLHFAAVRHDRHDRGLRGLAIFLVCLLLVQITLGILTVYLRKPADVASSHVAVGALVLATTFLIAVRSMRLYSTRYRSVPVNRMMVAAAV